MNSKSPHVIYGIVRDLIVLLYRLKIKSLDIWSEDIYEYVEEDQQVMSNKRLKYLLLALKLWER